MIKHSVSIFSFLLLLLLFSVPSVADTGINPSAVPDRVSTIVCIDLGAEAQKTKWVSTGPFHYAPGDFGDEDDTDATHSQSPFDSGWVNGLLSISRAAHTDTESVASQRRYINTLLATIDTRAPGFRLTSGAQSARLFDNPKHYPRE